MEGGISVAGGASGWCDGVVSVPCAGGDGCVCGDK